MNLIRRFWSRETAQDLVEWSLLLALVVLGSAALMYNTGTSISPVWSAANSVLATGLQTTPTSGGATPTGGGAAPISGGAITTSGGGTTTGTGTWREDDGDREGR